MKLYRFNYCNEIIECKVVKETKRTVVYYHPLSEMQWKVLKKELDAPIGFTSRNVVATSREKLFEASFLVVDSNIEYHEKEIKRLQEEKNSILKLLNK